MNTNRKNVVRLTESKLRGMIKEAVSQALNEIGDTPRGQYHLGRATMRRLMNGEGEEAAKIHNYSKSKGITDGDWMTSPYKRGMSNQASYMHSIRGNDEDMTPEEWENAIKSNDEHYQNMRHK